jgi:hypothetical protein
MSQFGFAIWVQVFESNEDGGVALFFKHNEGTLQGNCLPQNWVGSNFCNNYILDA